MIPARRQTAYLAALEFVLIVLSALIAFSIRDDSVSGAQFLFLVVSWGVFALLVLTGWRARVGEGQK